MEKDWEINSLQIFVKLLLLPMLCAVLIIQIFSMCGTMQKQMLLLIQKVTFLL